MAKTMQIQNKYKHLHYLVCLGSGMRKASNDIVGDELPGEMQARLMRLSQQTSSEASTRKRDRGPHARTQSSANSAD